MERPKCATCVNASPAGGGWFCNHHDNLVKQIVPIPVSKIDPTQVVLKGVMQPPEVSPEFGCDLHQEFDLFKAAFAREGNGHGFLAKRN